MTELDATKNLTRNVLDAPKNLTRNVLVGMFAGVFIASLCFYFQDLISLTVFLGIEKYLFNLGGQIFKNLLPVSYTHLTLPTNREV